MSSSARVLIIVALIVLMSFMLRGLTNRFLFYPMRYPEGEWQAQQHAGAQDVWLKAADGVELNAWWFPKRDARFASLFLHGNAGNVTHRVDHAEVIKGAGSAVLVPDYRGYGKSKGHPSERGVYLDADAAYEKLGELGYGPEQIILHGESLGSSVATHLAARRKCAGLILESPFASLSQMANKVVPVIGPIVARGFETEATIRQVHVPLLIIHGDADEIVPFAQGEAVFRAANQPKQFWRIRGGNHNDLLDIAGTEYVPHLQAFYRSLGSNEGK